MLYKFQLIFRKVKICQRDVQSHISKNKTDHGMDKKLYKNNKQKKQKHKND